MNEGLIRRLQKIQNWAAKLIYKQSKYTHVTPLLNTLHWLPIVKRIEFKVLIFVHGCIYNTTPTYMSELITTKNYTRDTRQSENITLLVPKTNISYGSRAFSVIGPRLWNSLPNYLTSVTTKPLFKSKLKTYLFQ